MTTEKQFVPAQDTQAFNQLVADTKTSALKLAQRMLSDVSPETGALMHDLQAVGWKVAVEISVDAAGLQICMTCVSPTGERRVVASIAEGGPADAALQ